MSGTLLFDMTFHSCPSRLAEIRAQVRTITAAQGCSKALVQKLALVLDEAIANVIRHAYRGRRDGRIRLVLERQANVLIFRLRDYAGTVDSACIKPRDLSECRPGGLGINFIDSVMDNWQFTRPPTGAGNILTMTKAIDGGDV